MSGKDLSRTVAIVTGGAAGIGFETVRALASAGATVTIATRDLLAGIAAANSINDDFGCATVSAARLDLADLSSIRGFATAWGVGTLNLLINNAGIMGGPLARTADGFEMNFGVNHLGHFLLCQLLTTNLERSAPSRVVQLSSGAHLRYPVDLNDWNFDSQPYDPIVAYGRSKSATALTAVALSERGRSSGVEAYAVMPGVIQTGLFRHMGAADEANLIARVASMIKTPQQGAATTVWAAVSEALEGKGGLYLENCAVAGAPTVSPPTGVAPHAIDPETAHRLWQISSEAVNG